MFNPKTRKTLNPKTRIGCGGGWLFRRPGDGEMHALQFEYFGGLGKRVAVWSAADVQESSSIEVNGKAGDSNFDTCAAPGAGGSGFLSSIC